MFNQNFEGKTFSDVFPDILESLLQVGVQRESRNGKVLELPMARIHLEDPSFNPYEITPGRRVQLPAQIAETVWVLSGQDDIKFIEPYLPRAKDYSDDGVTWSGAYGPRIRDWEQTGGSARGNGIDQLYRVSKLLNEEPDTRRAVIQIFDPALDQEGKDIPCNNWISFYQRDGIVHAHVAVRSNDAFWGLSGINSFEWTFLLQTVAFLANLTPGSLTFSTTSLHLYEQHWERASRISEGIAEYRDSQSAELLSRGYRSTILGHWTLDSVHTKDPVSFTFEERWGIFKKELETLRLIISLLETESSDAEIMVHLEKLDFELFRLWAWEVMIFRRPETKQGLLLHNHDNQMIIASMESPWRTSRHNKPESSKQREQFITFVDDLHKDKNKAYGDSWMRRGELLGIMANLARKVDRLGLPGAGDNELDTAVDLLLYLVKYRLWLSVAAGYATLDILKGDQHHEKVMENVRRELRGAVGSSMEVSQIHVELRDKFEMLAKSAESGNVNTKRKSRMVDELIGLAVSVALREHYVDGLKTKPFNGYDM